MKQSNLEEPKDLRHKKAGRLSIEERSALSRRQEEAKDTMYLALVALKKQIPGASIMELCNIIKTCGAIIQEEDSKTDEDVTFDILVRKYHAVSVRAREAVQTPETIEEETD